MYFYPVFRLVVFFFNSHQISLRPISVSSTVTSLFSDSWRKQGVGCKPWGRLMSVITTTIVSHPLIKYCCLIKKRTFLFNYCSISGIEKNRFGPRTPHVRTWSTKCSLIFFSLCAWSWKCNYKNKARRVVQKFLLDSASVSHIWTVLYQIHWYVFL